VGKDFAIPKGSVVLVGSLFEQGEVSYAMASVRESKRFAGLLNNNVKTIPFIPIPLAGTDNPTLIRRMVDTSLWLESLDQFCLSSYHASLRKLITDSFGPANNTVHYMSELSLPATLDTYDTKNVMLPGWQNLPAALEALTTKKENELVTCLLKDVNSVFYTGLDENPNLSRSAARPLGKDSHEKKKSSTEATLTVGGSNATRLAEALANLGIDSYKLASPGWKLNKENVEKIVPDLKEILETIPKDAPVIFFCMDNTVFKVATAQLRGSLPTYRNVTRKTTASTSMAPWWLPLNSIKNQIELLKSLVWYCEVHTVLILCPVPRYATFRCCDDPGHCTNFDDPSYLSTLISDLARVKISITKGIPEATAVDTLEGPDRPGHQEHGGKGGGGEERLVTGPCACQPPCLLQAGKQHDPVARERAEGPKRHWRQEAAYQLERRPARIRPWIRIRYRIRLRIRLWYRRGKRG
jgi:hypothetical protein